MKDTAQDWENLAERMSHAIEVRILGARGSVPVCRADVARTGGSTACVEVRCGDDRVLLDAGTGIRACTAAKGDREHHVLLTHFHWDHLQGLPFFTPLYDEANTVHFYACVAADELERTLAAQMAEPYFPVRFDALAATKQFHRVEGTVRIGAFRITPVPLHHPGGSHGYVIEAGRNRIVYATDHEHGSAPIDSGLAAAAQGASLLIYDAHYTPAEYPSHRGWGHSTWEKGAALAQAARVGRLLLFHHHPDRNDAELEAIATEARKLFPATEIAAEGMTVRCEG